MVAGRTKIWMSLFRTFLLWARENPDLALSNDFAFGDSDKFPPVSPFAAHFR
jgi:hypothetical protein